MAAAKDIYVHCDELNVIPPLNRENWLYELEFLKKVLKPDSTILQIGSMDGTRIIALARKRPDVHLTGLEMEKAFIPLAQKRGKAANVNATFILGDITSPPPLKTYDYVICLNNTLGYIEEEEKAVENMKKRGEIVILSVYGEKFTDALAEEYFKSLHLTIREIKHNLFILEDFTPVKRYTNAEVKSWGGKVQETPLGYICILSTPK